MNTIEDDRFSMHVEEFEKQDDEFQTLSIVRDNDLTEFEKTKQDILFQTMVPGKNERLYSQSGNTFLNYTVPQQLENPMPKEEIDLIVNQMVLTQIYEGSTITGKQITKMSHKTYASIIGQKKGMCGGLFDPLTPGSLRGGVIALMKAAIGAGVLTLPYVSRQSGIIVGLFYIIIGAILAYNTQVMLMKAATKTGQNNYAKLVEAVLGPKMGFFMNLIFIEFTFGAISIYLIVMSKSIPQILTTVGMDDDTANDETTRKISIIVMMILIFPLACKRTLSELTHFSLLGIIAIFYIVAVVVVQAPWFINKRIKDETFWGKFNVFELSFSIFTGFATTIFAFACHTSIFMARSELSKPIERRLKTLFFSTNTIIAIFYCFSSIFGYISFLENTEQLIIERKPLNPGKDYPMLVAKVVIIIDMVGSYLLNQAPCRSQIFSFMGYERKPNNFENIVATAVLVCLSGALAITLPNIEEAFNIFGGFGATFVAVFFPMTVYVSVSEKKWYQGQNLFIVLCNVTFTFMGMFAAFITLVEIFRKGTFYMGPEE